MTRRSARGRAAPPKGQSTISFSNRVTKAVPKHVKASIVAPLRQRLDVAAAEKPEVDDAVADKHSAGEEQGQAEEEEEEDVEEEVAVRVKTESELRAETMSDAQISRYWKAIEAERTAPRVHQEDLSLNEKILRYFDVSSQYGPCIGSQRMRRWQRAERLGLSPPFEVLAVLLHEENKDNADIEIAHVDRILNSIAAA